MYLLSDCRENNNLTNGEWTVKSREATESETSRRKVYSGGGEVEGEIGGV